MNKTSRLRGVLRGAGTGAVAGLIGGAVMVGSEKIEQALTHRPNSYLPARALLTLLGDHPSDTATPVVWNHLMHYTVLLQSWGSRKSDVK